MKLGLETRSRTIAACALMSLAFVLLGRSLPISQLILATSVNTLNGSAFGNASGKQGDDCSTFDPTLHQVLLEFVESKPYEGTGRNIFSDDPEPVAAKIRATREVDPPEPAIPPARPPIALRFFGFASMLDVPRRGFFGEGDAVFVGKEGQIIDRRYRILKIDLNSAEVEDLIEQTKHKLTLSG